MLKIFNLFKIIYCANLFHGRQLLSDGTTLQNGAFNEQTQDESHFYDDVPTEQHDETTDKLLYVSAQFICRGKHTSCSFSFHSELESSTYIFRNQIVTVQESSKMYLVLYSEQLPHLNLWNTTPFLPSQQFAGKAIKTSRSANLAARTTVQDITQTPPVNTNIIRFHANLDVQFNQTYQKIFFVPIPTCTFRVYNTLCKLHTINMANAKVEPAGKNCLFVLDVFGNFIDILSVSKLRELLNTPEPHVLITETQFKALKSMDLEKTTHSYKTIVKVGKNHTTSIVGYVTSFFEDKVKKEFLESQTCFVYVDESVTQIIERMEALSIND